jgi:hypothetical protein
LTTVATRAVFPPDGLGGDGIPVKEQNRLILDQVIEYDGETRKIWKAQD